MPSEELYTYAAFISRSVSCRKESDLLDPELWKAKGSSKSKKAI